MSVAALLTGALLLLPSSASAAGEKASVIAGMVVIPSGVHERLYGDAKSSKVQIQAFALDRQPVSRGEYAAFARNGILTGGSSLLPITGVSWFAATAYCQAKGKRLPTSDEWEYTARASETKADATRDHGFKERLLGMYAGRSAKARKPVDTGFRNFYGVRGMHELVWEWTSDFKAPAARHSRENHNAANHKHDMSCASAAIGVQNPSNYPAFMRYAVRASLSHRSTMSTLGFRCAADIT